MTERRLAMVAEQIVARGVRDARVLDAMRRIPREHFVAPDLAEYAYRDRPLPIEAGQTISQPYVVALMLEAARIAPGDHVLEIGVGSGYAAALLSRLAKRVHAIDRHRELAERAGERIAALGLDNVGIRAGDGTQGWPEHAPFDAILVAAGSPSIPPPLLEQLATRGRLVIPVGSAGEQRLIRVTRTADGFDEEKLDAVHFVPLVGEHGWVDEQRRAPG